MPCVLPVKEAPFYQAMIDCRMEANVSMAVVESRVPHHVPDAITTGIVVHQRVVRCSGKVATIDKRITCTIETPDIPYVAPVVAVLADFTVHTVLDAVHVVAE